MVFPEIPKPLLGNNVHSCTSLWIIGIPSLDYSSIFADCEKLSRLVFADCEIRATPAGTGPEEYLHRESSRASGLARGRMVLFLERFAGQLQCFGDGSSADRVSPLPNN